MTVAPDAASLLVAVLAAAGLLALLVRLALALARLGLLVLERSAAEGLAEVSERRGDVTAFLERRSRSSHLRGARRRAALLVLAWCLLLAAPAAAGVAREVYAISALLWLLPRPGVLHRTAGGDRG
jgi:hypothetical protein